MGWFFTLASGGCLFAVAVFVVTLLLLKLLWAWTVPDLFPGAVEQGLIAREITWWASLKLAVFLAVLAGIAGARGGSHSSHSD